MADKTQHVYGADEGTGRLPSCDDSSINETNLREFQVLLNKSVRGGQLSSNVLVSTYSLMNTPIDVGNGTGNFNSTTSYGGITYIDYNNPCNISGIITQFQVTLVSATGDFLIGIFTKDAGNYFTATAWSSNYSSVLTGTGLKTITGLFLPIAVGQYIGCYIGNNSCVEVSNSGGSGVYYVAGRPSENTSTLYTLWSAAYKMAIYGTGGSLLNYSCGVLAPNGDIHFTPWGTSFGTKVNYITNVVSTYSILSSGILAFTGGVLAPNGDIHFIPDHSSVGQKVSSSGVVSTYSLVYTTTNAYAGGVLAPNGDIHFVPYCANKGQKVSSSGAVSTYTLVYTLSSGAYAGGVLAPNGDIHFIPRSATVGQKVSSSGVVSTYTLVYTRSWAYCNGVLASNGDIHFVPLCGSVGQKININGVVSTYSLAYATSNFSYGGGVLAPNGDILFIPLNAPVWQKVSVSGVVSTFSLAYTSSGAYAGGVLAPNGDIHLTPRGYLGQKISTIPAIPFSLAVCCSPFFNKY